ncbi:NADPH-glutathione reductase [Pseudoxanthobacter soli DSM 19599]|uniref:Glutathione reductase n=1 Tax=Pseudoxanthobacter soli DSM 19599 TaxID=1123029 RepID=A0A1M7Z7X5_9HYPH|nr:glutathione-disulfide reductase [Pseudoxanthobacter soli]SHO60944.1 NADPH-glutathione reductase [Pseudoxanthobacter soli DSM 19599]
MAGGEMADGGVAGGFDYDLFVIGAGSGGVRAARIASGYGAKVAIAEEYRIGGTCVIRGCVPKKLLVYASRFAEAFEDSVGFGWRSDAVSFDWPTLIAAKDKEIARLSAIYERNLDNASVEVLRTRAVVEGPNAVRLVAEDRVVTARIILVATGGAPSVDHTVPGIELAVTSNEVFDLERLPERVVIVGGGYIAVEFAGIFNGLGVETTVLYRGSEILRGFDDETRGFLHEEMVKKGITILCGDKPERIERVGEGLVVTTARGETLETDLVMTATGRHPNTAGLGLEAAGVALDLRGAVLVDARSQTNVPSIYAVGDVTDRINLTPVAIREGHAFADTVFGGREVVVDHELVPTAVFSQPEIGTVGLTEAEAKARFEALDIYRARFRPMIHTLSGREERMFMKILVDAASDRVVGVHILGPDAGEMAQILGIAVRMGATKADFDATMAVHPTAAEELVTMRTPSERWKRDASAPRS